MHVNKEVKKINQNFDGFLISVTMFAVDCVNKTNDFAQYVFSHVCPWYIIWLPNTQWHCYIGNMSFEYWSYMLL